MTPAAPARNVLTSVAVSTSRGPGPDGNPFIGVNVNTLDDAEVSTLRVVYFDGRHDRFEAQPAPMPMLG